MTASLKRLLGRMPAAGAGLTTINSGLKYQSDDPFDAARCRIQRVTDQQVADALMARYAALLAGAEDAFRTAGDHVALEAVLKAEGRPALKVDANGIAEPDPARGDYMWIEAFAQHLAKLKATAAACAAVMVSSVAVPALPPTMQGTAFLIAPDLAVTNRHVVRPPNNGQPLARRRGDDPSSARIYRDLDVRLDFARYVPGAKVPDGAAKVVDVLYLAPEEDPVDIAILQIEPTAGAPVLALGEDLPCGEAAAQVYTVGHPGLIPVGQLDAKTRAVFGDPDGTKRLSLGERMGGAATAQGLTLHDCSTIGGFSGAPLLDLGTHAVVGLHYFGDPADGNRAINPSAIRASGAARYFAARSGPIG